jgi:very-short-patch-repair endonuclease
MTIQEFKKQKKAGKNTKLEDKFYRYWKLLGGPDLFREYSAIPSRKFRFDFAHPAAGVLIEINGGIHLKGKGGHSSFGGLNRDAEKVRMAAYNDWFVLSFTTDQIKVKDITPAILFVRSKLQ